MAGSDRWQLVGVVTFVLAGILLVSMGGAIVAAPVTVPLLWLWAARHPTRVFRVAASVLAVLTVAEVGWAATYLSVEEAQPWIWAVPCVAAAATAVLFARQRPNPRSVVT